MWSEEDFYGGPNRSVFYFSTPQLNHAKDFDRFVNDIEYNNREQNFGKKKQ